MITKNSIKQFLKPDIKKVFVIIVIFVLFHNLAGGAFGLRPTAHGCLGIPVSYSTINKFFPKGNFKIKVPFFSFQYFAPSKALIQNKTGYEIYEKMDFCLGQDIWFGE
jgi:hypothetical protein